MEENKEKLDINEILNNNDFQMNFEKLLDDPDANKEAKVQNEPKKEANIEAPNSNINIDKAKEQEAPKEEVKEVKEEVKEIKETKNKEKSTEQMLEVDSRTITPEIIEILKNYN